jgi:predicted RNase H-like HicB family nuclease
MKKKVSYTYWKDDDGKFLGYLNEYPDHWTQGTDLIDLKEHLIDLDKLFSNDEIEGGFRYVKIENDSKESISKYSEIFRLNKYIEPEENGSYFRPNFIFGFRLGYNLN